MLSQLLLLVAIIFSLYITAPLLEDGYQNAGDDPVHVAYDHELEEIVTQKYKIFGWSYLYGLGAPIFILRPPGFYVFVVLFHLLTFKALSLVFVHKLFFIVCFSLYPLGIYYLLKKFQFPDLVCGIGALFAITPISSWGHTLTAYFHLGLAKQLIAIFIFPFALGKVHGTLTEGGSLLPATVLIAAMFLIHPYMAYCFFLILGFYLAITFLGKPIRVTLLQVKRTALISFLFVLLSAFYLIPFYTSPEIQREEPFSSTWRHGFEVITSTVGKTLDIYIGGGLLDTTAKGGFGEGMEWGWKDNARTGRLPILTWSSLVGLLITLCSLRYFKHAFWGIGFLVSFIFFLGPDDVPILHYLPFQNQFQYIHAIFLVEIFAIALAAIGMYYTLDFISRTIPTWLLKIPSPRSRTLLVSRFLFLVLLTFALGSVYIDRFKIAKTDVDTRKLDTVNGEIVLERSALPMDKNFETAIDVLKNEKDSGRFYGSATGDADIFYYTIAPYLVEKTDLISGFFSTNVSQSNRLFGESFRSKIPESYNLLTLSNTRYLFAGQSKEPPYHSIRDRLSLLHENRNWVVFKVKGEYGHFSFMESKPILVFAGRVEWLDLNKGWLDHYQDTSNPQKEVFFVKSETNVVAESDPIDFMQYSALLLLEYELGNPVIARDRLQSFLDQGGTIISRGPVLDLNTTQIRETEEMDVSPYRHEYGGTAQLEEIIEEREHHGVQVKTSRERFLFFKMAYYRGWAPYLDGKRVKNYCVSPGFNAILVPPGDHRVEFIYEGPNHYKMARLISLSTLTLMLYFYLKPKWLRRRKAIQ